MSGVILFTTNETASKLEEEIARGQRKNTILHDVSSRSSTGRIFSPFSQSSVPIPIPGRPNEYGHSVEAIWQGLKLIDGKTDEELIYSKEKPFKRKVPVYAASEFQFGDTVLDLASARKQIYVPTYTFFFQNGIPDDAKKQIANSYKQGFEQYFFDVDDNPNINDTSRSYSHASLLVNLLQKYLHNTQ